jgi:hypothetical protein
LAARPAPTGPNQCWLTDITYLQTAEGWLYLAAILDRWSRRIVGWACGPTLHASLVLAALDDALKRRQPPEGLLHHSDRGSQYVDDDYIQALSAAGIERSMSRAGNCYDNAAKSGHHFDPYFRRLFNPDYFFRINLDSLRFLINICSRFRGTEFAQQCRNLV